MAWIWDCDACRLPSPPTCPRPSLEHFSPLAWWVRAAWGAPVPCPVPRAASCPGPGRQLEALGCTVRTQPGWVGSVLYHRNAWVGGSRVFGVTGDLSWPHLFPRVLPRGMGQLLPESLGLWLAVLLPAIPGGVYQPQQPSAL